MSEIPQAPNKEPGALRLSLPDGKPVNLWMCADCLAVGYGSESAAVDCCRPKLCECGEDLVGYHLKCSTCTEAESTIRQSKIFADATKIFIGDYQGEMVCVGDEVISTDQLEDYVETYKFDNPDAAPLRVYATQAVQPIIDAHAVVENALDDSFEDAQECVDTDAVNELNAYLREWSIKHLPVTYFEDTSIALVPWPAGSDS